MERVKDRGNPKMIVSPVLVRTADFRKFSKTPNPDTPLSLHQRKLPLRVASISRRLGLETEREAFRRFGEYGYEPFHS